MGEDVIVLGNKCLPSSIDEDGMCHYHPYLTKYNSKGKMIWEKRWTSNKGPESETNSTNMAISGNRIYTIHDAWEFSGHNSDIMLTTFDGDGNKISNQIIKSQCQDYPAHISSLPENKVMITGLTDGWVGESIETADCEWENFKLFSMILDSE